MKVLKVVHIIASNSIGGAEQVLLDICRSLKTEKVKFEAALFVQPGQSWGNAFAKMLGDYQIPLHFIEMHFPLNPSEILQICRIVKKTTPSVVHCHGMRADLFGGIAAKLCGVPAVTTVHGWVPFTRKMKFYTWLDLKSMRLFDTVMPVSRSLEKDLARYRINPLRVRLVPNVPPRASTPVRAMVRKPNGSVLQIGFVGRLSPEKGPLFLIDGVAKLKETVPLFLHIAGDGPEMAAVQDRIRVTGLEDRTKVYGYFDNPRDIYNVLDVLVLPSLTEGIPLALLEAMSFGLPVIASGVGGIPEIVEDNVNGLIVRPGMVSDLAEKIGLLARDHALRERIGNAARERVAELCDHHRWEQQINEIYQRYGGDNALVS
ncbi:MAG TPA: glycosyltransferase [Syntrophorhabdaceae bacterium]